MLFNSIEYMLFLPLVLLLYWVIPKRFRYTFLLVASYLFYMNWIPIYVLLILGQTVANYGLGLLIARRRSKRWLVVAVSANLGLLSYFKYANFFIGTARAAGLDMPLANILLPLGISFFTFEFIHYIVDVWRGGPPVRNFVRFALFAAFFPTQIAGPIKRYPAFLHQLEEHPRFAIVQVEAGLQLIVRGLFKKVVLADNLARIANTGFDHPAPLGTFDAWIAVWAFAFQIFFDFSGYTDIGRGSALLFGFTVPENFDAPYLARNLALFWRRWHMSLSSWLRDYLFIPLGGSRGSKWMTARNLFLTMTLGGLWHGAAWHFVLWGAVQGLGLAGLRLGADRRPKPPSAADPTSAPAPSRRSRLAAGFGAVLAIAVTFQCTCLAWVLFRGSSLEIIGTMLGRLLWPVPAPPVYSIDEVRTVLLVGLAYFVFVGGWRFTRSWVLSRSLYLRTQRWAWPLSPAFYLALVVWMLIFPASAQQFIYFQF